jgi:hypothetical protein
MDTRAETLLHKSQQTLLGLRSLHVATESIVRVPAVGKQPASETWDYGIVRLLKPNYAYLYARHHIRQPSGYKKRQGVPMFTVSDGKQRHSVTRDNRYSAQPAPPDGAGLALGDQGLWLLSDFFKHPFLSYSTLYQTLSRQGGVLELTYKGKEAWDSLSCDVVVFRWKAPTLHSHRLYFSPDGLLRRSIQDSPGPQGTVQREYRMLRVRKNETLRPADFRFSPPRGVLHTR